MPSTGQLRKLVFKDAESWCDKSRCISQLDFYMEYVTKVFRGKVFNHRNKHQINTPIYLI